ncbi:MAG TPA: DUF4129 domain-containing protein [Nocardioides sp.]|jgi:uncharacterized protein DUF4129|nr:DUF4129 domain-containing protein [Nocardioides sp.]
MTARRASVSAVALTVLSVGVLLLLVMLAARTGPQRIVHGTLRDPSFPAVNPSYTPPTLPAGPPGRRGSGLLHSNPVFEAIGWAIRLAVVVALLWLLYRGIRRLREVTWRVRRPAPKAEQVDFDVLDDPEPLAEEMRRDAEDQFALLLGGSPRNAIVACWDRFEEQAERVNAARRPWETSSEFTLRLLDAVSADPFAVSRLEGLYREARFSAHDIDEARRESAVEALRAIQASLGSGVAR